MTTIAGTTVVHLVMFDISMPRQQVVGESAPVLQRMRREIPGLLELYFGPHDGPQMYPGYVDRCAGHNFALVSRHLSRDHLRQYASHPAHLELVGLLKPHYKRAPVAVDFE